MKFSIIDDSINTLKNIKNRGIPSGGAAITESVLKQTIVHYVRQHRTQNKYYHLRRVMLSTNKC